MNINKCQLNISHLKMICTIDQAATVKEAAQALFITQPALTNRIREAERRLKTHLFIRKGRKLIITSAGKRLLDSAQKILEELERAEYDIALLAEGIEQVLRIGTPHYASFKWLPFAINTFNEALPNIELEITANTTHEPMAALLRGDIDIAMISSPKKRLTLDEACSASFILQDELLACLSSKHKNASKHYLEAEEFSDEVYITNSTVPEKDREYELFFKPKKILPRKVLQVGFNEAIIELVKANMGLTIMSERLIEAYLFNNEIKTVKLGKSGLKIYWHLVYLKQNKMIKPVKLLTQILQERADLVQ